LREAQKARLMIESIRAFGGTLAKCPVWLFHPPELDIGQRFENYDNVKLVPLLINEPFRSYLFSHKVFATAQAEETIPANNRQVVWLDFGYLAVRPFDFPSLAPNFDFALRPVHIRNVGSPAAEPPDGYWSSIYKSVGLDSLPAWTVESFVDGQAIWPYYNVSGFAFDPERKMMSLWREHFAKLVCDQSFQARHCPDSWHRIFLHQAVFSALIAKHIPKDRIYNLPTTFAYPLHLHKELVAAGRALSINDVDSLLCDYEGTADIGQPYFREAEEGWMEWMRGKGRQIT
jgi:hypothetical protein